MDATTPLPDLVEALNEYEPEALIAYASVLGMLADEQLEGRLSIEPRVTIATSEVLTEQLAERVGKAWGAPLHDVQRFQVVNRRDGLLVRDVPREGAERSLPEQVRAAVEASLADAGAHAAVSVDVVRELEREAGPAGKLELVRSAV